jgi:hypothetical protein
VCAKIWCCGVQVGMRGKILVRGCAHLNLALCGAELVMHEK